MNEPKAEVAAGSGAMFDGIAGRYDALNRVMSLGVDRRWRRRAAAALALESGARVLDLATGTADLALEILRQFPDASVVGLDPSAKMLEIGAEKAAKEGVSQRFHIEVGAAESLDHADASFDAASIAFGIRNCVDRPRALGEMARVVRPGGRIAILEASEPGAGPMAALARFHIHQVIPRIGALFSGAREYRYLQESIAAFPPPAEFAAMMSVAGIEVVKLHPLMFGSCHLYIGESRIRGGAAESP